MEHVSVSPVVFSRLRATGCLEMSRRAIRKGQRVLVAEMDPRTERDTLRYHEVRCVESDGARSLLVSLT